MSRDLETNPYSKDEERVAKFLWDKGIGGGDDPVGFILSSYDYMNHIIRKHRIDRLMDL